MTFRPNPHDELALNGVPYRVAEHPAAPGMPHGQEGRAGTVYRLLAPAPAQPDQALKVFKPRFRLPGLVTQAERLAAYADLPGLRAARRTVLTPARHPDLLRQHPDLTYAVLMPWIEGPTWLEVMVEKQPLPPDQALALARALAETLTRLEERGLAHCDLSGPNLMLPLLAGGSGVELIDLEGVYAPGLLQPQAVSSGSAGYAHAQAAGGLWGPDADRFAGAVLLAEMLAWCDPQVVQAGWGESYFEPGEMQQDCPRSRLLCDSLRQTWGEPVAALFERAWRSDALADCPTFGEWLVALLLEISLTTVPDPSDDDLSPEENEDERKRSKIYNQMQNAKHLEENGDLNGAMELYRQAQQLAVSTPSLRTWATEITATLKELEVRRNQKLLFATTAPEKPLHDQPTINLHWTAIIPVTLAWTIPWSIMSTLIILVIVIGNGIGRVSSDIGWPFWLSIFVLHLIVQGIVWICHWTSA